MICIYLSIPQGAAASSSGSGSSSGGDSSGSESSGSSSLGGGSVPVSRKPGRAAAAKPDWTKERLL